MNSLSVFFTFPIVVLKLGLEFIWKELDKTHTKENISETKNRKGQKWSRMKLEKEKWDLLHFEMMERVAAPELCSISRLLLQSTRSQEGGRKSKMAMCTFMCECVLCNQTNNSIKSISPPTLLPSVLFSHSTAWLIVIKDRLTDGVRPLHKGGKACMSSSLCCWSQTFCVLSIN